MFALPGAAPNQAPTAAFGVRCGGLTCSFDASASADVDGDVAAYSWKFGDGSVATGAQVQHAYTGYGSRVAKLKVTDDASATGKTTRDTTTVASKIQFIGSAQQNASGSGTTQTVTMPPGIAVGDQLVLTMTYNSATVTAVDPPGWARATQAQANGLTTVVWTRMAPAGASGSSVAVSTSAFVKSSLLLGAYRGAAVPAGGVTLAAESVSTDAHTTPADEARLGSWLVSVWTDKSSSTMSWTPPFGEPVRQTGAVAGTAHISWLMTDSGGGVVAGPTGGLSATASFATSSAAMLTVVLTPLPRSTGG